MTVRIDSTHSAGGWNATNTRTGKRIRIKSAQRLRGPATSSTKAEARGAVVAAKVEERNDRDRDLPAPAGGQAGRAPRSELTLEEADKLAKVRAAKARKSRATDAKPKPKRVSALDAAAEVLKDAAKPMRCKELINAMAARGLWSSPNGRTPEATLYAAIMRETKAKGDASRFRKVDRGMFAFNKEAK